MKQSEFEKECARLQKEIEKAPQRKVHKLVSARREFMEKNAPFLTFFQAVRYLAKNRNRALFFNAGWGDGPYTAEDRAKFWSIIYSDKDGSDGSEIFAYVSKEVAHSLIQYRCVYSNSYGGYKARKIHESCPEACIGHIKTKFRVMERDRRIFNRLNRAKVGQCKNINEMFEKFNEVGFKGYIDTRRDNSAGVTTNTFFLMGIKDRKKTIMFNANVSARPKHVASIIGMNLHRIKVCLEK